MNLAQQKANAKAFVARWKGAEGNEDREARSFWIQFAEELLGISNATYALDFERRVKGRKIDVFYEDMGILIENKSRGCSLDEQYVRSKKVGAETPYEQAKWYADNLPYSIRPRWIVTCNFDEIRIHDLDKQHPGSDYVSVSLDELPDMLYLFCFFTDKGNSRVEKEKRLSVKAGELVGKLYDELSKQYQSIGTDKHEQRSLNVLCVRLVFLLYAEDAGLLARRGQFYDYLKSKPANRLRTALLELFEVLDTPEPQRSPYLDPELAAFPYINGGLFTHEDIVIPNLTDQIKVDLLAEASAGFNWKDISPTIFGAAFESTLNPETRRAGGMHYTSPENIHKVIDPLFLNDLKAELAEIEGIKTERDRVRELRIFQRKLASLTFLDPAAGSHNFLTETYLSIRKLELRIIENLQGEQTSFDLIDNPIMVNIGQFYAIEINDFAVSVGKTALWIAEQQMMEKTQELLPYQRFEFLPLKSITNSVCANALRIDWNDVIPAEKCSYIIGNPPFLGYSNLTSEQQTDRASIFGSCKVLDYVACWYGKAVEYMDDFPIRAAFVSTNSICQGQQVEPLWKPLFDKGIAIDFAHQTFVWNNEASNQAHVHVVIVGFSKNRSNAKLLHTGETIREVENINGYLAPAPNSFVTKRSKPLCEVPEMIAGGKPADGGFLLLTPEEKEALVAAEPETAKWIRPFSMGAEFINKKDRYCLWLVGCSEQKLASMPAVSERVESVRHFRLSSTKEATRKKAATPWLFDEVKEPQGLSYIVVPKVSSERRKYVPIGFVTNGMVPGDKLFFVENAGLFEFAILTSQFHNAWMRAVAGRLKSDYSYSNTIVYNNFVWPRPRPARRDHLERCAQLLLDIRADFPDRSLAELYDPNKMPGCLRNAHELIDEAVEGAYGVDFGGDEERIVAHLFELYAKKIGEGR